MAYDTQLAEWISILLERKGVLFEVKKMMGGWCAMIDEKMCVGIMWNYV